MSRRVVADAERRARLGIRQRLCDPAPSVESVANDLVVLHASDPASVFLAVSARMDGVSVADVEASLFEKKTMLRTLAMRRTLFVVTTELVAAVERSCSMDVAATERKRLEKFLSESGIKDPGRWLADAATEVVEALPEEGLPARSITSAVPRLATKITMAAGTKHSVEAGATSRVLGVLAAEGIIIRGRPTGDWTGRQYRWHRRDRWWPEDSPAAPDPEPAVMTESQAASDLLRHWLSRFGPATTADMKWWTGWTMTKTKATLATLDTAQVELAGALAGQTGHLLAEDEDPIEADEPWARLLPSLDPTAMGWKERDWYLGDHRDKLFDRNGNIGPTVWADGRIVGGWSQRPDGEVVTELLEPVGTEHQKLIDEDISRVATFVGQTVIRPSFPTPLQKKLSAAE